MPAFGQIPRGYWAYQKPFENAKVIECLQTVIECGNVLRYAHGVKIAQKRIQKIDQQTEVYALSNDFSSIPFFSAKHEPMAEAYFGRVVTADSNVTIKQN